MSAHVARRCGAGTRLRRIPRGANWPQRRNRLGPHAQVVEGEFTFVTNNAADFRRLYAKQEIHAGLIIIVPQVPPARQRELFHAIIEYLAGAGGLINAAIEIYLDNGEIRLDRYTLPTDQT